MINTAKGITKGQIHVLFNDRLKTSGASVLPFSFTVTVAAGETVNLELSVHTGKTAKVQWGDGMETTVSYSGGNFTGHTNVYAAAGTYTINIVDADNLNGFRINSPTYNVNIVGALPVNLTYLRLYGSAIAWTYTGALPVNLTYLSLYGNSIAWTYSGALPMNLTYLYLYGDSIAWTYSGALPVDLTTLQLYGNLIAWTYSGALPMNLTYLRLYGSAIAWTYTGALPVDLTYLSLYGNSIAWTYSGALPMNLTYLYLYGDSIAWTYSGALLVNLTFVYLNGNAIAWTYISQSYKSTLSYFLYLPGAPGRWLSATVDQVIADLKTSGMGGTVDISGDNEARTSASDQDLFDLRANGATVTVNEY